MIVAGVATPGGVWGARRASVVDDSQAPEQLALFDIGTDERDRRQ